MKTKAKRPEVTNSELNLIPILDAVFILIFFLLFSTQFIKMYEIDTAAPLVRDVPQEEIPKQEPLNLRIKVHTDGVDLLTGIDSQLHKSIKFSSNHEQDMLELKQAVYALKLKHVEENHAIVVPNEDIQYEQIVKIIDAVQRLPVGVSQIDIIKDNKKKKSTQIFEQIVLEPLEDEF